MAAITNQYLQYNVSTAFRVYLTRASDGFNVRLIRAIGEAWSYEGEKWNRDDGNNEWRRNQKSKRLLDWLRRLKKVTNPLDGLVQTLRSSNRPIEDL